MTDKIQQALKMISEMLPKDVGGSFEDGSAKSMFAGEIGKLALKYVFAELWTREGLGRRDRSILTLGILIALRASDELEIHFGIAHNNGLSLKEIEEIIYHATGYAGFPAANSARAAATKAFRKAQLID